MKNSSLNIVSPFPFFSQFVNYTQNLTATVVMSHLYHLALWGKQGKDEWIRISFKEWEKAIGASYRQVRTAVNLLLKAGLIEVRKEGVPAQCYYRVVCDIAESIVQR